MVNTLTAEASLLTGPLVLGTLVSHYLDRIKRDASKKHMTQLRRDELLYDEAFSIIKKFLKVSTYHTLEEVQAFGNTPTPSPPWVHVVKVRIPMSCCDEAANILIQALGGEGLARHLVGGVKWWQVRGINGVDGEWITAKKDWQEAKRRYKMKQETPVHAKDDEPADYQKDMDNTRCILYIHGGGYYFGSVDQERYSIQRHARKINGRVFAMNYRLSPQYPFPCALQDVLASYLYLIRPPPEAKHRPVNPAHIVISGDSAGGGISMSLLQVIRDAGLPAPAGGALISPWCDLTHSFPSIHLNTATDVIPKYGLSLQKPSLLWPPPSQGATLEHHASLRSRIRKTLKLDYDPTSTVHSEVPTLSSPTRTAPTSMPVDVGATASLPSSGSPDDQTIVLETESGEILKVTQQVHMYTQNSLLNHPLVSPCLSYLGGLPPLLIIASDKEVLRDEIIYSAHKAAYPERFPVTENSLNMYPVLNGIESKYGPTSVHLQVYDDTAHVIPVLFSFTTPGKYCFRSIASFIKHVTNMSPDESPSNTPSSVPTPLQSPVRSEPSSNNNTPFGPSPISSTFALESTPTEMSPEEKSASPVVTSSDPSNGKSEGRQSFRRSLSASVSAIQRRRTLSRPKLDKAHTISTPPPPLPEGSSSHRQASADSDVGGPRFGHESASPAGSGDKMAGEPKVYSEGFESGVWDGTMIRERVSTKGVIRPLEPEEELDAMKVPARFIGSISELAVRRFMEGLAKFDKKFAHTSRAVEKSRHSHIERGQKDIMRNMATLQHSLEQEGQEKEKEKDTPHGIKEGIIPSTGSWTWSWVVDGTETPPPSSIVARRDTAEARRLAKIADFGMFDEERTMTANNLWSVMVNFLTASPDHKHTEKEKDPPQLREPERKKTLLSRLKSTPQEKKVEDQA